MKIRITSAILLFSLTSCGQQDRIDCKETLQKTPYFIRHRVIDANDSLQIDFDILKNCGNLDSIDQELLAGPMLGSIMVQHPTSDKVITYNTILKSIQAYRKTGNYSAFREAIITSKTLENKMVTVSEFEKDRPLLVKAGLSQSEADSFKIFIQKNTSQKMTYKEAFAKYDSVKQSTQPPPPVKIEFNKLVDIETAIKTGKEQGKRILLYFSGYACVNARKVEDGILTDSQVKILLSEKFVSFKAYVDDRSEDKTTNSTIGKRFMKLQQEKFNTTYQPYFCIIDHHGKVLSEIGYTNKTEDFIQFLSKGLE